MPFPLLLASQSPARLSTLRSAGVEPDVIVSDVDEDAALDAARASAAAAGETLSPADAVLALARAKAEHVAAEYETGSIVLGCDSMLELDGEILGKPADAPTAVERWRAMRGRTGVLHTGHWLVDDREDGTGGTLGATSSTVVRFADLTDAEIDAYVATGEPLKVAGAFTVDGLGGPYVEAIEGDYHGVVGVSLPLLRHLLAELGVAFHELRD
ncbi:Maf family protein [Demequina subtropica]|uniref:Maf family protein n=1 Tax=Demequina subtropica TaxID=1638989 RepID=UPI0007859370|nr:Maf family protein [Demequina subtropica]